MTIPHYQILGSLTSALLWLGLLAIPQRSLVAAPDVKGFFAMKARLHEQVSSGPARLIASNSLYGVGAITPYGFGASVFPTSTSSVNSATLLLPTGTTVNLPWRAPQYSSDSFGLSAFFQEQSALDVAYPNGSYTFTMNTVNDGPRVADVSMTGDVYPTPPHIANYSAAQAVNPGASFNLVWDAFADGTANDFIKLEIDDPTGGLLFGSPDLLRPGQLVGTATSYPIPANTLAGGRGYTARVKFWKANSINNSSYPGVVGAGVYSSTTEFLIATVGTSVTPDVWYFLVGKANIYQQTGNEAPSLAATNPYASIALLRATAAGNVATATFQTPGGITKTFINSPDPQTFRLQEGFATQSALDAVYGTGTYTATARTTHDGTRSLPLDLAAGSYPAAPQFVNASQTINPSNSFRLWWNLLPGGTATDYVQVDVMNASGNSVFTTPGFMMAEALDGTATFVDIPANTLVFSNAYTATILLARGVPTNFASYAGVTGYACYASQTRCSIGTFPSPIAPTITKQPQSRTNIVGTAASFSVIASGTTPLHYQWWLGSSPLGGATNPTYTIASVQTNHAGDYRVVVSNTADSITSSVATLTVVLPPTGSSSTNNVLNLGGNNDYVNVPSAADLQNPTAITIEFWVYPTLKNRFSRFLNKGSENDRQYDFDWVTNGGGGMGVEFFWDRISGAPDYSGIGGPVLSNRWTHIAATFSSDQGVIQFFTNGILAAQAANLSGSLTNRRTLRQTAFPVVLGGPYPIPCDCSAAGQMDEIRIWSVARTGEQIRNSMRSRLTGNEQNLAGYWNFDAGNFSDLTGHGHNGTANGSPVVSAIPGNDEIHAAKFQTGTRRTNGITWLSFELATNISHFLQASPDLVSWTNIATVVGTNSPFQYSDESAGALGQRFYRIITP
ncbi:MAG: hypothetical protein HZA90_14850 [Verrucomicrobia bacterium]|nr:hypothetical protein [Verrucomicrobiota bacterium]